MDTISQNKNTVTSFIDALFTKGDLGAVDEYLAEDFVDHDPPMGGPANREGMRQAGAMFRAAFPDWHSDLDFLVEEDDLVVENFTASGTQQGEIFGVPASGRTVSLPGINIWRVRDEVLRRLRLIMSVDAAFFGTVDPQTLLFTSAVAEEPLGTATPLFLDNEYGRGDVNKFAALAEAADPVGSLDRATRGQRPDSARYREVMSPLGLGDELRAVLISGKQCWGAICLHREDAEHGFDDREVDVIRRIAPHVAEGLRRAVTLGPFRPFADGTAPAGAPGIILLDQDLALMTMSPEAAQWLAEIDEADWPGSSELPMAVYAAAARLARLEQGAAPPQLADMIRLRSRAGQWLSLHASRLGGGPAPQIGVVIEPTPAAQLGSLLLSAYGLTSAQSRVVALVIRGHSTRQIVEELHISANTVQEHLTAAFDKFGVRSRRELVTAMLTGGPG
jgi:steroid delta-isomerase-like uncharacterized protein